MASAERSRSTSCRAARVLAEVIPGGSSLKRAQLDNGRAVNSHLRAGARAQGIPELLCASGEHEGPPRTQRIADLGDRRPAKSARDLVEAVQDGQNEARTQQRGGPVRLPPARP